MRRTQRAPRAIPGLDGRALALSQQAQPGGIGPAHDVGPDSVGGLGEGLPVAGMGGPARPDQCRPRGQPIATRRSTMTRAALRRPVRARTRCAATAATLRQPAHHLERCQPEGAAHLDVVAADVVEVGRIGDRITAPCAGVTRLGQRDFEQRHRAVRPALPGLLAGRRQSGDGRCRARNQGSMAEKGSRTRSRNSRLRPVISRRTAGLSRLPWWINWVRGWARCRSDMIDLPNMVLKDHIWL